MPSSYRPLNTNSQPLLLIRMFQQPTRCSAGRGASVLSGEPARVAAPVRHRGDLPPVSDGESGARRIPLSTMWPPARLSHADTPSLAMCRLPVPGLPDGRDGAAQHEAAADGLVLGGLPDDDRHAGDLGAAAPASAGLRRYETAWMLRHKLRRAMVNVAREPLHGEVEIDDTWGGGPQPGLRGSRQLKGRKAAIVLVAAEKRGRGSRAIALLASKLSASATYFHASYSVAVSRRRCANVSALSASPCFNQYSAKPACSRMLYRHRNHASRAKMSLTSRKTERVWPCCPAFVWSTPRLMSELASPRAPRAPSRCPGPVGRSRQLGRSPAAHGRSTRGNWAAWATRTRRRFAGPSWRPGSAQPVTPANQSLKEQGCRKVKPITEICVQLHCFDQQVVGRRVVALPVVQCAPPGQRLAQGRLMFDRPGQRDSAVQALLRVLELAVTELFEADQAHDIGLPRGTV